MRRRLMLILLALVWALPAHAQDCPRGIRILTTSGAGTVVDIAVRELAEKLSKHFGQTFVVINSDKAHGQVVAEEMARKQSDGCEYLVGTGGTLTVRPATVPSASYKPDDYTPVALIIREFSLTLVANNATGVKTLEDLVSYSKKQTQPVRLAVAGSTARAVGAVLIHELKLNAKLVTTYRSPKMVVPNLAQGLVEFGLIYPSDFAGLRDSLTPVVCLCSERSSAYPDVPTIGEKGYEDIGDAGSSWAALVAPKGLPDDILKKLNEAVSKALAGPDMQKVAKRIGTVMGPSTPDETARRFQRAYKVWQANVAKYPELKKR